MDQKKCPFCGGEMRRVERPSAVGMLAAFGDSEVERLQRDGRLSEAETERTIEAREFVLNPFRCACGFVALFAET